MTDVPYNPMSRTEAFSDLTSKGMSPDTAFIVLTLIAADTTPGAVDAQHMADVRELALAYVRHTGQESLLVGERGAMNCWG